LRPSWESKEGIYREKRMKRTGEVVGISNVVAEASPDLQA